VGHLEARQEYFLFAACLGRCLVIRKVGKGSQLGASLDGVRDVRIYSLMHDAHCQDPRSRPTTRLGLGDSRFGGDIFSERYDHTKSKAWQKQTADTGTILPRGRMKFALNTILLFVSIARSAIGTPLRGGGSASGSTETKDPQEIELVSPPHVEMDGYNAKSRNLHVYGTDRKQYFVQGVDGCSVWEVKLETDPDLVPRWAIVDLHVGRTVRRVHGHDLVPPRSVPRRILRGDRGRLSHDQVEVQNGRLEYLRSGFGTIRVNAGILLY
jgi:hypothetical protein